jgi:hypothetical protein
MRMLQLPNLLGDPIQAVIYLPVRIIDGHNKL